MRLRVLGAGGSESEGQRPPAFLIDDHVLLDAGTVPAALDLRGQAGLRSVLISHAHLDHVVGLVYLLDNLAAAGVAGPLSVAGVPEVVRELRASVFNNVLWPDFSRIPTAAAPCLAFRTLPEATASRVDGLAVTPVRVDHTIPTTGFIVDDGVTAFVYSGDTGPTERLWTVAGRVPHLRAAIVETALPDRLAPLAQALGHLTPSALGRELAKIPAGIPIWIYHVAPAFRAEIAAELGRLDPARIQLLEQDRTYTL